MSIIIADIGASNARLAVLKKSRMSDIYQFSCDDFKTPENLFVSFRNAYAPDATALIVGVAGVVVENEVCWTNRSWKLDGDKLKKKLSLKQVVLKNDVEVQCMSLPYLGQKDYQILQKGKRLLGPKALLSFGTGVGASYCLNKTVFATEYGQTLVTEDMVLEKTLAHLPAKPTSAFANRHRQQNVLACQKFYQNLARIVANMILTLKTTEGIYLYGNMLDAKMLRQEKFVNQIVAHPTMRSFLKTVPIVLITRPNLAFVGLKALAKQYDLS